MLLALSVSLLQGANKDLGVNAGAHHVVGLLRMAHQQSRSESSPAWVVLDTKQNGVYTLMRETVGEWHLEDASGAFGKAANIKQGTPVQGRVGKGIQLAGSGSIDCGEVPVHAPDQGIAIEFWFLRRRIGNRATLATVGDAIEITAEADGHVEAKVGSLRVSSGQLRLPAEAWCRLQLVYSGRHLRLLLNGREVAQALGRTDGAAAGARLVIGGTSGGLTGIVDEIRLGLILPRDLYLLPSETSLEIVSGAAIPADGEVAIAFDAEGRLDAAVHAGELKFALKSAVHRKEITVGLGGTVSWK